MSCSIYLAQPTRGSGDQLSAATLAIVGHEFREHGTNIDYDVIPAFSVTFGRNEAARRMLRRKDATHLFFVDDDTQPPQDVIERLLALDADVATGVTPALFAGRLIANIQAGPFREIYGHAFPSLWPEGTPDIDRCGLSCCLIRREVIEALEFPWFTWWESEDGQQKGEDLDFCNRVKAAGFTLRADCSIRCGHTKTVNLLDFAPIAQQRCVRSRISRTFRITGLSRSGTAFMAALLQAYGYNISHESMGADGTSSWTFAVANAPEVPAIAYKGAVPAHYRFDYTIHVVRNPVDVIASITFTEAGVNSDLSPAEAYRAKYSYMCATASPIERAAQSYIAWNRLIEAQRPDALIRVENANEGLAEFFELFPQLKRERCKALPAERINSRQHEHLSWEQLHDALPETLYLELYEMAKRYGYN